MHKTGVFDMTHPDARTEKTLITPIMPVTWDVLRSVMHTEPAMAP